MASTDRVAKDLWEHALTFLPEDLNGVAVGTGAMRRPRRVLSAAQMLRSFLLYAHTGSFRVAAALAKDSGLLDITAEGLFYRLRQSEAFLEQVLVHLVGQCSGAPVGFRLLLVDATTVTGPGSVGTDWRIHVVYDPSRGVPCSVVTTDNSVGESLRLHPWEPGQLVIGDKAYGTARNLHAALTAGADVLIRVQQGLIRLLDDADRVVDWKELEARVPVTGAVGFDFKMPVPPPGSKRGTSWKTKDAIAFHRLRLVGARVRDGEVIWLVTNLPEHKLDSAKACELYRVRWQVELYFKRLKSLGDLDVLNSREGPTAKAAILAKLILLVLTNLLCDQEQVFSPFGYRIRQAGAKPVEGICLPPQTAYRSSAAHQPKLIEEAAW